MAPQFAELLSRQARALGQPECTVIYRQQPEDFHVDEALGFDADGDGDHVLLQITKTGLNTADIVDRLVARLGVKQVDVGFCGLKDRIAVTRQWFSVHVPGRANPLMVELLNSPSLGAGATIERCEQHRRKLRPGSHQANRFELTLRAPVQKHGKLLERAEQIRIEGFPNYFGEQRFGHGCRNLDRALLLLSPGKWRNRKPGRRQRSLYLSAARSFLFNEILASRINAGTWLSPQPGEPLMLAGSRSFFLADASATTSSDQTLPRSLEQRIIDHDVHTTGALWGRSVDGLPLETEREVAELHQPLAAGLEQAGLTSSRRALRAVASEFSLCSLEKDELKLSVRLDPGVYATSLLRELCLARSGAPDSRTQASAT
ncbi:MAG: tRNA pseudouridine(13) synthase TruD [Gammaproteobacteria bacterium]|nr:tRNA pseudouridine(13) synthase TruD [Gammaproteobacteria bacterium]